MTRRHVYFYIIKTTQIFCEAGKICVTFHLRIRKFLFGRLCNVISNCKSFCHFLNIQNDLSLSWTVLYNVIYFTFYSTTTSKQVFISLFYETFFYFWTNSGSGTLVCWNNFNFTLKHENSSERFKTSNDDIAGNGRP